MAAPNVVTSWVGDTAILHVSTRGGGAAAASALRQAVARQIGAITPGEWLRAERAHGGREALGRLAAEALGQPYDKGTRASKEYKAELRALQRLAKENGERHTRASAARAERLRGVAGRSGVRNPFAPPPEVKIKLAARGRWNLSSETVNALKRLGEVGRGNLSAITADRRALADRVSFGVALERLYALQAQITFG